VELGKEENGIPKTDLRAASILNFFAFLFVLVADLGFRIWAGKTQHKSSGFARKSRPHRTGCSNQRVGLTV
jgi:hypothetical protein